MGIVYLARMEIPALLVQAFDGDDELLAWVNTLRPSWLKDMTTWIMEPKGEAARIRRAEQLAERLLETKDAEAELPPLMDAAFRARPKARAGWLRMTPIQRRTELFRLFYYRKPEQRQAQIAKLCAAAEARA